jgi:hypothetical protein
LGQLTEQHGYEMIPTVKAFAVTLGFVMKDQTMKSIPIKDRNQLTKQTRMSYHLFASLLLADGFSLLLNHASQGGFFSSIPQCIRKE